MLDEQWHLSYPSPVAACDSQSESQQVMTSPTVRHLHASAGRTFPMHEQRLPQVALRLTGILTNHLGVGQKQITRQTPAQVSFRCRYLP